MAWEYKLTPSMGVDRMNIYGRQGWELFSVSGDHFYWKRPIPPALAGDQP